MLLKIFNWIVYIGIFAAFCLNFIFWLDVTKPLTFWSVCINAVLSIFGAFIACLFYRGIINTSTGGVWVPPPSDN